jgi:hypothetical protein
VCRTRHTPTTGWLLVSSPMYGQTSLINLRYRRRSYTMNGWHTGLHIKNYNSQYTHRATNLTVRGSNPARTNILSSRKRSDRLSASLLFNRSDNLCPFPGVTITTHLHPAPRLKMRGATPRNFGFSGMLRSVDWYLVTDVSGQPISPNFKGPSS